MAEWQSLRGHVATNYHVVVDELERFQNPDWDGLSVRVATPRGQRLVALHRRKDYNGDWFVQVFAPIATTSPPNLVSLLEWNGRSAAGSLLMADGELLYKRVYPLDWLSSKGSKPRSTMSRVPAPLWRPCSPSTAASEEASRRRHEYRSSTVNPKTGMRPGGLRQGNCRPHRTCQAA